jgi:hypothetical protein
MDLPPRHILGESLAQRLKNELHSSTVRRRCPYPDRTSPFVPLQSGLLVYKIDLVEHLHLRYLVGPDLLDDLFDLLDPVAATRVGGVDHVQQESGLPRLLERGPKSFHQLVWKVPDESDGIGQNRSLPFSQINAALEDAGREPVDWRLD